MYSHQPSEEWHWSLLLQYISYLVVSFGIFCVLCSEMKPKIAANVAFYYFIMCMINMVEYFLCITIMEIILITGFSTNTDPERIELNKFRIQFFLQILSIIPLIFSIFETITFFAFLRKYYLFIKSEEGLSYD